MFVQESTNTKPQNQNTQIEGLQTLLTEPLHKFVHAHMQVHCRQTNHSKTKYCTRSRSPRKPTTTFLLGSWNRHLSCLSNCCLAMTCSAAKLWPLLLFRCSPQFPSSSPFFYFIFFLPLPRSSLEHNSKCQNVQIGQGTFCFWLLGLHLKISLRSQRSLCPSSICDFYWQRAATSADLLQSQPLEKLSTLLFFAHVSLTTVLNLLQGSAGSH